MRKTGWCLRVLKSCIVRQRDISGNRLTVVLYFNYYLGRQDVLSINKGRKQLNLFLDYVGGAVSAGGGILREQQTVFPGGMESSKQAVDAGSLDYRKEEQEYELWRADI